MALGGTTKLIPPAILGVVATTPVMGYPRRLNATSANMLGSVQDLCGFLLLNRGGNNQMNAPAPGNFQTWIWDRMIDGSQNAFMTKIGDAELWARLCSIDNPMPILALQPTTASGNVNAFQFTYYDPASYPAGAPIGNDRGTVDNGWNSANLLPWCIVGSPQQVVQAYVNGSTAADGKPLPMCPPLPDSAQYNTGNWATRGAINAGLSVFLYLNEITKDGYSPLPSYDQCQNLPQN
jgi:hypothetical protein